MLWFRSFFRCLMLITSKSKISLTTIFMKVVLITKLTNRRKNIFPLRSFSSNFSEGIKGDVQICYLYHKTFI